MKIPEMEYYDMFDFASKFEVLYKALETLQNEEYEAEAIEDLRDMKTMLERILRLCRKSIELIED